MVLGDDDSSGLFEYFLGVPVRVDASESFDDAVVFAHEEGVDDGEGGLFGRAAVAGDEAETGGGTAFGVVVALG